ncbi:hypothetical protein CEUSTIGMA_g13.t1 [Chlamydomonas eustigma]|uniref:EF-hand domain-containing protein n=1 Tax=Chlamydomonas eustigma TaxID=1157962 RepID=A0A250WP05_9CHLO|nr:hypothetical protein CEUSTIGMA_g13.t1 [Chlamydomonas eustigma]|eukprot:GAX72557.1 hypothetical protein CEUSTIGMA_g13.t1 [Chlamydomonas eustigma]
MLGDISDLQRKQQLDKAFFQPQNRIVHDLEEEGPTLPPIPPRTAVPISAHGNALARSSHRPMVSPSPLAHKRAKSLPPGVADAQRAVLSKRKANFNPLHYGSNPSNPYEAVVEGSPSARFLGSARDGRLLELQLPSTADADSLSTLEVDLETFISENLNGPLGPRVDAPRNTASTSSSEGKLQHYSGSRYGCVSSPQQHQAACTSAGGSPAVMSSGSPHHILMTGPWVPESPPESASRGKSSLLGNTRLVPLPSPALSGQYDGGPREGYAEFDAMSSRMPSPSKVAFKTHSQQDTAAGSLTARVQHASLTPRVVAASTHGAYSDYVNAAGYGPDFGASGRFLPELAQDEISLGRLIGEKHSSRRQVQLMTEWLDNCIASAWSAHAGSTEVYAQQLRSELKQQHQQQISEEQLLLSTTTALGAALVPSPTVPAVLAAVVEPPNPATAMAATAFTADPSHKSSLAAKFAVIAHADPKALIPSSETLNPSKGADALLFRSAGERKEMIEVQSVAAAADVGVPAGLGSSRALWSSMLQAVSTCASSLTQHMAASCYEEGVLLARLWNLQTSLMDAELAASRSDVNALTAFSHTLNGQVQRLEPFVEWEREGRLELAATKAELSTSRNALDLAVSERNALLRENDKIIAYYRKELKVQKSQAKKDTFRLAFKVRNAQAQLALMNQDREQLVASVISTKKSVMALLPIVIGIHQQMVKSNLTGSEDALDALESGLKNIQSSLTKVEVINKESEEVHFDLEERVTAKADQDNVEDAFVDQFLLDTELDDDVNAGKLKKEVSMEASVKTDRTDEAEGEMRSPLQHFEEELDSPLLDESAAALEEEPGDLVPPEEVSPEDGEQGEEGEQEALETEPTQPMERSPLRPNIKETYTQTPEPPLKVSRDMQTGEEFVNEIQKVTAYQAEVSAADLIAHELAAAGYPIDIDFSHFKYVPEPVQEPESPLSRDLTPGTPGSSRLSRGALPASVSRGSRAGSRSLSQPSTPVPPPPPPTAAKVLVEKLTCMMQEMASMLELRSTQIVALEESREELVTVAQAREQGLAELKEKAQEQEERLIKLREDLTAVGIDPDRPAASVAALQAKAAREGGRHHDDSRGGGDYGGGGGMSSGGEGTSKRKAAVGKKAGKSFKDVVGKATASSASPGAASSAGKPSSSLMDTSSTSASAKAAAKEREERERAAAGLLAIPEAPSSPSKTGESTSPGRASRAEKEPGGVSNLMLAMSSKVKSAAKKFIAPTLGKDRAVADKKEDKPALQRLQESLERFAGIKPRTLDWLLKLIEAVYKGKPASDDQRVKAGQEPLPLLEFVFQHLTSAYGTRDLVNQYMAQVIVTLEEYKSSEPRLMTFEKFLRDKWNKKILSIFLEGLLLLQQPARLPCCDYPPDYAPTRGGAPVVDIRKCLWVTDRVLMKRHAKTAYAFAASLALKGESVSDAELQKYFTAPGYYGPDVVTMLNYERGRAEFRRLSGNAFLEALCEEYKRCENVYMDLLPQIFQRWDKNENGYLTRDEVELMLAHMAPKGTTPEELLAACNTFWDLMIQIDNEELDASGAPVVDLETDAEGVQQKMMGYRPFMEAALRSDFIRGYVRLYKTPPAKLRVDNSAEDQARLLLLLLVKRHWSFHGPVLLSYMDDLGAMQAALKTKVDTMEGEQDGSRMALTLHSVLRTLINRKIDTIITQLNPKALSSATIDPDFEDCLDRLTSATKILYGSRAIIVEDVLNPPSEDGFVESLSRKAMYQKNMAQVITLYNAMRGKMTEVAVGFMQKEKGIREGVKRWRMRAQARLQAAKEGTHIPTVAELAHSHSFRPDSPDSAA